MVGVQLQCKRREGYGEGERMGGGGCEKGWREERAGKGGMKEEMRSEREVEEG